jgi:hypothetical protein
VNFPSAAPLQPGEWILDPFGSAPRLAIECARQGYRVLVVANNPIARFLLEIAADPPTQAELRLALADLAASHKGAERLEPHLRSLYHTICAQCGSTIEAQAYIWERDAPRPSARLYDCPHCKDSGEHPATQNDVDSLSHVSSSGLHRARAAERVASLDDPDRAFAEEALNAYLPRAVYALFSLVNKLDNTPGPQRRPLAALLLYAFDQANTLWPHPAARTRPLQLTTPPRFLEKNVWLSLEAAVADWMAAFAAYGTSQTPVPLSTWPDQPPVEGGICLFEGRLKDLVDATRRSAGSQIKFRAALAPLPRPNQAFWTLSALWAGWLWGREASAHFKSVLRRRRYDWAWHTAALGAAFQNLGAVLHPGTPFLGLLSEVKPGFITAAVLAGEMAGFEFLGAAMRPDDELAQLTWQTTDLPLQQSSGDAMPSEETRRDAARQSALGYLAGRGEPAGYIHLHCAALTGLAQSHNLIDDPQATPFEIFRRTEDLLKEVFSFHGGFQRYGGSQRSLDIGQWWLRDDAPQPAPRDGMPHPLADRVEMEVVRHLQSVPQVQLDDLDRVLCVVFPGLFTPDLSLIQECLASYGEQVPAESGLWRMRAEDAPKRRRQDLIAMRELLQDLGQRLGYETGAEDTEEPQLTRQPVVWRQSGGGVHFLFYIIASAVLGSLVYSPPPSSLFPQALPGFLRRYIVLPGGRASLVDFKLRCDARLRQSIEQGWGFLKFRHLRSLSDIEHLNRENLAELLAQDPLANKDPQMQLL